MLAWQAKNTAYNWETAAKRCQPDTGSDITGGVTIKSLCQSGVQRGMRSLTGKDVGFPHTFSGDPPPPLR